MKRRDGDEINGFYPRFQLRHATSLIPVQGWELSLILKSEPKSYFQHDAILNVTCQEFTSPTSLALNFSSP